MQRKGPLQNKAKYNIKNIVTATYRIIKTKLKKMFKILYTIDMPSCLLLWPLLARLEAKQCNPWSQCFTTVIAECAVPSIVVWLANVIVVSYHGLSYCCIITIISIHAINCYHIAVNTLLCQLYLVTYMTRLSYYNSHCFCMRGWVFYSLLCLRKFREWVSFLQSL